MGLLLAPVSLSYDWQTGSIPAIVNWSDGRNVISILFYLSITALAVIGFIRTNVIQVLNSTRIYICQLTFKSTENRYLERVGHDCSNGSVFQSLLRCGIRRGRATPLHAQVNFK